ncbi:MAG TPA: FxSxx-COOH system tetratricopeptide repeat protein, partial [Kineosporiaceae bacterium]
VGKTQLVLEYAHRFMADYDLVWWIPAQQEELIPSVLAEIAPQLGIRRGENIEEAAEAVLEALRRGQPYSRWLIIFDNAEDPEALQSHLPQGNGHVVITSRNPSWAHLAIPLEVEAFTREESVEHLTRRVPALTPGSAGQVAQLLGDLPLAIELASAWLETTGMPVPKYVALLETQLTTWLASSQPSDYPSTAAATWSVSIERLRQEWPAAVRLLELCSCFGAEPISMNLLYSDETLKYLLPYDSRLQEKLVLGRIIQEIGRYALARVDRARSSIQVHRLVQAVIKHSMTEEQKDQTQHEVHRILVGGLPTQADVDKPENWPRYNEIWPHLAPSEAHTCMEDPVRYLLVQRVRYLWRRGEYADGLVLARRLESSWLGQRGPDDRQLLYLRSQIANIIRDQGDYRTALEIDQDVLARQSEAFGADYVHTLMTATALAVDLSAVGRLDEGLSLAERTADSFTTLFGEDDPMALNAANNLALCLRAKGQFFQAREIDRRTLALRRQVFGEEHPRTLSSALNLARDLRHTGDFDESTALLRSTLERHLSTLGKDNPNTMRTAGSLAISLRKSGLHDEALQLSRELLRQYELTYPADYPDALACRLNLACDLSATGDPAGALVTADIAASAYHSRFGSEHQFTLVSENNRAIYLRQVGKIKEARRIAETTYRKMKDALGGEEHPFVLACAMNVASALADDGDLEGAETLDRATEQSFTNVLGARHPDRLFCRCNLAVTLRARGNTSEAQDLLLETLTTLEAILGATHPQLDHPRRWRRVNRDLEPQAVV